MFSASSRTSPVTLEFGVSSCILFKHLTKVDLPHPEGPIMAVTMLAWNDAVMPLRACLVPNQAFRPTVLTFSLPLWKVTLRSSPFCILSGRFSDSIVVLTIESPEAAPAAACNSYTYVYGQYY